MSVKGERKSNVLDPKDVGSFITRTRGQKDYKGTQIDAKEGRSRSRS